MVATLATTKNKCSKYAPYVRRDAACAREKTLLHGAGDIIPEFNIVLLEVNIKKQCK